ncbi:MAG: hypothetical protein ABSE51_19970 [Terracidiphilus sp.]
MSSTATPKQPEAPPTEQIFGIAKKIALELEKLPLHTHATVVNMLRMTVEHRKVELDNQVAQAQVEANEAAMAEARKAHAQAQVERNAAIAAQMTQPAEEKKPRISLVLDKSAAQPCAVVVAVETENKEAARTIITPTENPIPHQSSSHEFTAEDAERSVRKMLKLAPNLTISDLEACQSSTELIRAFRKIEAEKGLVATQ